MGYSEKIVAFDIWCQKCKHRSKDKNQEPIYWEERR